jgi:hypothetical protein
MKIWTKEMVNGEMEKNYKAGNMINDSERNQEDLGMKERKH